MCFKVQWSGLIFKEFRMEGLGGDGRSDTGKRWEGGSGYSYVGGTDAPVSREETSSRRLGKAGATLDAKGPKNLTEDPDVSGESGVERIERWIKSSVPPAIADLGSLPLNIPAAAKVPGDLDGREMLAKTLPVAESPLSVKNRELTLDGLDEKAQWIIKNLCSRVADKGLFNLILAQLNHTYGKDVVLMAVKQLLIGKTIRNIFSPFDGKPVEAKIKFVIEGEISELICLVEIAGQQVEVDLWTILKLNPVAGIKPTENGSSQA